MNAKEKFSRMLNPKEFNDFSLSLNEKELKTFKMGRLLLIEIKKEHRKRIKINKQMKKLGIIFNNYRNDIIKNLLLGNIKDKLT